MTTSLQLDSYFFPGPGGYFSKGLSLSSWVHYGPFSFSPLSSRGFCWKEPQQNRAVSSHPLVCRAFEDCLCRAQMVEAGNRCVLEASSHLGTQVVHSQERDVLLRAEGGASPNPATGMTRLVHLMRTMTLVWQVISRASVVYFEEGGGAVLLQMWWIRTLCLEICKHTYCVSYFQVFVENPCAVSKCSPAPVLFRHHSGHWSDDDESDMGPEANRQGQSSLWWALQWLDAGRCLELGLLTGVNRATAMGKEGPIGPYRLRIRALRLLPGCVHLHQSKFGKIQM